MIIRSERARRIIAGIGDGLTALLLVAALSTAVFGGFRVGSGIFAISTRSVSRLVIDAIGIVVLRHLLVGTPSLREQIQSWIPVRTANLSSVPKRELWLAALAYAGLTLVFLWPQIALPGGVPDHGDPLFSMWTLSHISTHLTEPPSTWLDGAIFHPERLTFLWSDLNLLPGLMAAPFLRAGLPLSVVYTSLIAIGVWLSGVTMYALVRATTGLAVPALTAGALFAFLPYRFAHYSHLQMQGIAFMPLAVLLVLRLLAAPTRTGAVALGVVVAAQTLWSTYCGAYLVVGLICMSTALWLLGPPIRRSHVAAGVMAAGVAAALLTPYVTAYYQARAVVAERSRGEVMRFSAQPSDYLSPSANNALYRSLAPIHEKTEERHLFAGIGTTVLAVAGLTAAPSTATIGVIGGLVGSVDASFGLSSLTFTTFFDYVPLLRSFRSPARFGLVVGVFLVWGAGLGTARLWRWSSTGGWRRAIVIAIAALAVFEARPHLELLPVARQPAAIYDALPADRRVVLLELPVPGQGAPDFWVDPSYVYAATFHRHRLVNGYSGHFPEWYASLGWASTHLSSPTAWKIISNLGAEYLIIHERHYGPERFAAVVQWLDGQSDVELITTASDNEFEDRLYRFRPQSTQASLPASAPAPAPRPLQ